MNADKQRNRSYWRLFVFIGSLKGGLASFPPRPFCPISVLTTTRPSGLVGHALACRLIIGKRMRNSGHSVDYLSQGDSHALWPSIEEGCLIFIRMVSICS